LLNGIDFEYINNECDTTIVFLHGWGLSGDSFDKIISCISGASIIKFDLPGFGKSNSPKDYFDTYEYAYQIFLCLKKIKVNKIVIVGHSFGGRLSILLSSVFNIDVIGCMLASSAGLNRFDLLKTFRIYKYKLIKKLVSIKFLPNSVLDKYGSRDYKNAREDLKAVLRNVVNQDLSCYAKKIKVNTILVWDKKDKETKYWICRKLHRYIKLSKMIKTKNGGHFTLFFNSNKISQILMKMT
jgi:pimeloyl-ACP methyl ester carboxylesterase